MDRRIVNHNNKILLLACIANGASFSMILPLLAPLTRELQLTELQGAALISISSFCMALAAVYISKSQQKFSVYQLLSVGFVGMTLTWAIFSAMLMYGLFSSISASLLFVLLMLSRAATGLFMAMPQIALQTHVMTQAHTEKQRSKNIAKFGVLASLGMMVGPLLTTLLLAAGIFVPLWIAILILALLSGVILIGYSTDHYDQVLPVETASLAQHHQTKSEHTYQNQPVSFSADKTMIWLILGFSLYLAIVTLNLTAGFYIQDYFQLSARQGAVYFSQCVFIAAISLALMQMLISKYLQCTVQQLLWVGLVSMLTGLIISFSTDQLIIFQTGYVLYGVSIACLTPAFTTGAAQTTPQEMQTKIAAWCTATQALSFVVGPLISAGLYQLNPSVPYYFLTILMVALMLFFALTRFDHQQSLQLCHDERH